MNLTIMTYEESVRWYIPETENEKYLISLMEDFIKDYDADEIKELRNIISELKVDDMTKDDEITDLQSEIDDLKNDINDKDYEISELESKIENLKSSLSNIILSL